MDEVRERRKGMVIVADSFLHVAVAEVIDETPYCAWESVFQIDLIAECCV